MNHMFSPINRFCRTAANAATGVWRFYLEGFRQMTVGRKLWALIIVKLIFIFLVLKLFFFPDILSRDFDTDQERANHVRKQLMQENQVKNIEIKYITHLN